MARLFSARGSHGQLHTSAVNTQNSSLPQTVVLDGCSNACSWPPKQQLCLSAFAKGYAISNIAATAPAAQPVHSLCRSFNELLHPVNVSNNGYHGYQASLWQDKVLPYKIRSRTSAHCCQVLPCGNSYYTTYSAEPIIPVAVSTSTPSAGQFCKENVPLLLGPKLLLRPSPPQAHAATFYVPSREQATDACAMRTNGLPENAPTSESCSDSSKAGDWLECDELICSKHDTKKKGRKRLARSGRRKFRCEVCTSILSKWTSTTGLHPSSKEKNHVLKFVGMSKTQLNNWLDNRRRSRQRAVRSRKHQAKRTLGARVTKQTMTSVDKEWISPTSSATFDAFAATQSRILTWLDSVRDIQDGSNDDSTVDAE